MIYYKQPTRSFRMNYWVAWQTTVSKYCRFANNDSLTHTPTFDVCIGKALTFILVCIICDVCHMQKKTATRRPTENICTDQTHTTESTSPQRVWLHPDTRESQKPKFLSWETSTSSSDTQTEVSTSRDLPLLLMVACSLHTTKHTLTPHAFIHELQVSECGATPLV